MPSESSALQVSHGLLGGFFNPSRPTMFIDALDTIARAGAYSVDDPRNLMALPNDITLANALAEGGTPIVRHASNHLPLRTAQAAAIVNFLKNA